MAVCSFERIGHPRPVNLPR